MKRSELLTIVEAALAAGQSQYARQAAAQLLAAWPGDLTGQIALARAYVADGEVAPAIDLLEAVIAVDPERSSAQRELGRLFYRAGRLDHAGEAHAAARVVDGRRMPIGLAAPAWAEPARQAALAVQAGDWETARDEAQGALKYHPDTPLPSLLYLRALWRPGKADAAAEAIYLPLAEGFHRRWPGCVAFSLCLAECLLHGSPAGRDPARAIALLHEAGALDPAAEVVARYWGAEHPFRTLWPFAPDPELPGPLPQEVATALGMNRLRGDVSHQSSAISDQSSVISEQSSVESERSSVGGDQPSAASHRSPNTNQPSAIDNPPLAESLADIRAELDRIAARIERQKKTLTTYQLPITQNQSRNQSRPIHLILSSKTRLVRKFGAQAAKTIDVLLSDLAEASGQNAGINTVVVYADSPDSLRQFNLKPVNPENAWEIKLLLRDIAAALRGKARAIASVLIVGGDDVIPFHRLPNPTDDSDSDVPSDNPYATPDENYYVLEWAIGRLPAPAGGDPAPLIRLLRAAIAAHRAPRPRPPSVLDRLRGWWALLRRATKSLPPNGNGKRRSFGYVARAWRHTSAAVFAPIGDLRDLNTCPPLDVSRLPAQGLSPSVLAYFNLHGVEDGAEWYGQREAGDLREPQFPIALRPRDVVDSGRAPEVVFTEACFGTNIFGKNVEEALCLKFLDSGARGVVGSTKIAYGAVGLPLIGADLLGRLYWNALKEGWPMGEALRRAKLAYAQETHGRQSFLDGEDQKTLISFVLYGDPLLPAPSVASPHAPRLSTHPALDKGLADLTLCADEAQFADLGLSRPETVAHIKSLVARHLPGMEQCDMRIAEQHRFSARSALRGENPGARLASATALRRLGPATGNLVFTLSKTVHAERRELSQFVRVTVDKRGKVVKMAVSR